MTFAARDFSPRRGVSDEHIPQWICEERATKSGRKRPAALRVAPNLACGFVARRLQPHGGDAPSSRLATGQIGRNERHRIYASDHLAGATQSTHGERGRLDRSRWRPADGPAALAPRNQRTKW